MGEPFQSGKGCRGGLTCFQISFLVNFFSTNKNQSKRFSQKTDFKANLNHMSDLFDSLFPTKKAPHIDCIERVHFD